MTLVAFAQAPVRADFTGGYTDVAPFSDDTASVTVNAAIGRYARVVARARQDGRCVIFRDGSRVVDATLQDEELTTNLAFAAALRLAPARGIEIHSWLDVPPRSGLGTSGATSVALACALSALKGDTLANRHELAEVAADIERSAGIAGGRQDQFAASFGGANAFRFAPRAAVTATPLDEWAREVVESCLILHDGQSRHSQDLVIKVMARYAAEEYDTPTTLASLAAAGADVQAAFEERSLTSVGESVNAVLEMQERLDEEIQSAIATSPVRTMVANGLCWAKPLGGAGFGAAWVALPKRGRRDALLNAAASASLRVWPCTSASGAAAWRSDAREMAAF